MSIPDPPRGAARLRWLGPGLVWMVSAAGSGELLFTPRIGALYGYSLVWAMLAAVLFKWAINREVGRFAVCSGAPLLEGVARLRFGGWAVAAIALPQLLVAVATIAGLGGGAATAVLVMAGGDPRVWATAIIISGALLVGWGQYSAVERTSTVLGLALGAAAIAAGTRVLSNPGELAAGLVPQWSSDVDSAEVIPWLGFVLSGAAGLIWYSYWLPARHYGAAGRSLDLTELASLGAPDRQRLRGWIQQMTLDNSVAVGGTTAILLGFLVLGTELLKPSGLLPEEQQMGRVLASMLADVWGPFGFWLMAVGILIGFASTVISDQDGFARLFAHGSQLLGGTRVSAPRPRLHRWWLIVWLTVAPIVLYLLIGEPVRLLQIAGGIEAAHIPVVAALSWRLNRQLPAELRPSLAAVVLNAAGAIFFAGFAAFYIFAIASR